MQTLWMREEEGLQQVGQMYEIELLRLIGDAQRTHDAEPSSFTLAGILCFGLCWLQNDLKIHQVFIYQLKKKSFNLNYIM